MSIHVQLLGYLSRYSPTGEEKFLLELPGEATVGGLLDRVCFPAGVEKMILVNGRQANPSTLLADGDEVFIFMPAAGG